MKWGACGFSNELLTGTLAYVYQCCCLRQPSHVCGANAPFSTFVTALVRIAPWISSYVLSIKMFLSARPSSWTKYLLTYHHSACAIVLEIFCPHLAVKAFLAQGHLHAVLSPHHDLVMPLWDLWGMSTPTLQLSIFDLLYQTAVCAFPIF